MANYGLIKLRLADGRNLSVRGSVTENPSNISIEPVVNHNGSVDGNVTMQGYRGAFALAARDRDGALVDIDAIMRLPKTTLAFLSDAEKSIRTYSGAQITGDPQVDLATGEVSGLAFTAEGRQETRL